MTYRGDIDGLRTVAVFMVILNHAGFGFFSGGFIGVDVFFVISGFLITSIIFPQIESKTFNFLTFLSKRIKRLMPVLLFVILITLAVFSFILLPHDLINYYKSVIWVTLDIGNFFMWQEYGGYFDGNSQEVPLLHTWSLAVEEQYYFFWPLMLIISFKYLGHKRTLYLALFGCIIATIFSQWGTKVTIGAAYYLLPTRFFELLIGSSLALYWKPLPYISKPIRNLLSLAGLLLIIISAIMLSEHSPFPGYNALYPVIGTALIIYSASGIVNKILSLSPIVFTGKISYSLYLWHWPIFVFVRYTTIELNIFTQILCILLTYILSVLSWKYIEQPLRYIKVTSFKKIATQMYAIPAVILIIFSTVGIMNSGYQERFPTSIVQMDNALNSHSSKSRQGCHSPYRKSEALPKKECIFGGDYTQKNSANIFIFGDSHANHLVPFINVLVDDAKTTAQDYTLDQCLPIFDLKWGANLHKAKKCLQRNKLAYQHINNHSFDYVIMSASWQSIATTKIYSKNRIDDNNEKNKLFKEKFKNTIQHIVDTGAIPVIIEDTPTLGGKSPKCPIKKEIFNKKLDCSIKLNDNLFFKEKLKELKIIFPQLIILKPYKLFCEKNICSMSINGTPLFRDDDHLNEKGAELLGKISLKKYSNPLMSDLN